MSLLNRDQILARLKRDESEIFMPGTWRERQLRPAGYDLRIDSSIRALNDQIYEEGHYFGERLNLEPGDSAYVVSVERFCMPWDLAANLGIRFKFAREGLSVLTGLLVDPGFGRQNSDGKWVAKGAPLHFFLTNTGASTIPITLGRDGDEVLSIQFLETAELEGKEEIPEPGDVRPSAALWAFQSMQDLDEKVSGHKTEVEERFKEQDAQLKALDRVVTNTSSATENIVVFGIFLIAVTLFGVSATILVQGLANDDAAAVVDTLNGIDPQGVPGALVALGAVVVITAGIVGLILGFTKGFASIFSEWEQRRNSPTGEA